MAAGGSGPYDASNPAHIEELHKFLKAYGHTERHDDKHIIEAVRARPTMRSAKIALGRHPAFFSQHEPGKPVRPGEHVFTRAPGAPPPGPPPKAAKPPPPPKVVHPNAFDAKNPAHIAELHAFMKTYGHQTPHADAHILKAVQGATSVRSAKIALGKHPAFFDQVNKGKVLAPGEHKFTGKVDPRPPKEVPKHETALKEAGSPVHGPTAAQKHRDAMKANEKAADKIAGRSPEERRAIQAMSTSANAHNKSAFAAKAGTEAAHQAAANHHNLAAKTHMATGNQARAADHQAHVRDHLNAVKIIKAVNAAPVKAAPVAASTPAKRFTKIAASGGGHKASGWAAWRASLKK